MMATFDEGILTVSRPEKCGCQELLNKIPLVQYGWLRRKSRRNLLQIKYIKWPQQYVIIGGRCLYYFNNETSKSPDGAVSLYGFNRVIRASDIKSAEALWAFKLEHVQPHVRSIYLAAGSEREMVTWMKAIKAEMLTANNIESRFKRPEHSSESQSSNSSWDSGNYKDLEDSIYMEPEGSRISHLFDTDEVPENENNKECMHPDLPPRPAFLIKSDEVSESENINDDHDQPPVPARPAHLASSDSRNVARNSTLLSYHADDSSKKLGLLGYSLQNNVSLRSKQSSVKEHSFGQTPTASTEIENDSKSYWESVYFEGSKLEASELMNRVAREGVYLVRKSHDNSKVLLLYAHCAVKKLRIIDKEDGQVSLTNIGPDFENVESLLYYYYTNDLPYVNAMLTTPYKLSHNYQQ